MSDPKNLKPTSNQFPVVGVGASAGGLDAYKRLVRVIPERSGMAYVIIQHLDPSHESVLPDILNKYTSLPVHHITDNINLVPDHIYILPSNRMVIASDGILKLKARPPAGKKNMPIDLFFSSLAVVHKHLAAGILLSGNGTDGTIGLLEIKHNGGVTIAQEPSTAAYADMPQNAIAAEAATIVLTPEQMPGELVNIFTHINDPEDDDAPLQDDEAYRHVLRLLRLRRTVDFTYYKQNTIKRRIARRMALTETVGVNNYLKLLKSNTSELDLLFEDLLILVTAFFRDDRPFEKLKQHVFPVITKDKSNSLPLRIWIAACSTGQEVYSVAIALHEFLGEKASTVKVQIFGTDISERRYKLHGRGFTTKSRLKKFLQEGYSNILAGLTEITR